MSLTQPLRSHHSSYFLAVRVFIFLDTEHTGCVVLLPEKEEERGGMDGKRRSTKDHDTGKELCGCHH
ncbi:hypothetical protein E2C01_026376 [Portunus trituberculatus]|uniref:Uncharacterized protein n=1 Tax=Portunus trituberculatus TaxID=210409 RepID=A0A5B7EID9_PORTR|nr:hypothetical protein [Portunus trituberculatus]